MDKTKEFKIKYNKLLEREKKAEIFLNNAADEDIEKWEPEFYKITKELSKMMDLCKEVMGREMTIVEVLEGFNEI